MIKLKSIVVGAALTAFFVAGNIMPGSAASTFHVKLGDIKGSSLTTESSEEFEALTWSWGGTSTSRATSEPITQPGTGAGSLTVTKSPETATPLLMNYCATGKPLPSVLVINGAETYTLYDIKLKCSSSTGDADDRPTEEVAFYYNKISFNKPQRAKK